MLKHCDFLNFATTGYTINSGATVIPKIVNCVFDGADQAPINNASALTPAATDIYSNYFGKAASGSVPQQSIAVGEAVALDDDFAPLPGSALERAGTPTSVSWDYAGSPFKAVPSVGALQS